MNVCQKKHGHCNAKQIGVHLKQWGAHNCTVIPRIHVDFTKEMLPVIIEYWSIRYAVCSLQRQIKKYMKTEKSRIETINLLLLAQEIQKKKKLKTMKIVHCMRPLQLQAVGYFNADELKFVRLLPLIRYRSTDFANEIISKNRFWKRNYVL